MMTRKDIVTCILLLSTNYLKLLVTTTISQYEFTYTVYSMLHLLSMFLPPIYAIVYSIYGILPSIAQLLLRPLAAYCQVSSQVT